MIFKFRLAMTLAAVFAAATVASLADPVARSSAQAARAPIVASGAPVPPSRRPKGVWPQT